ncbi:hypothetical protein Tco_1447812 [Tanacetum coccineum]
MLLNVDQLQKQLDKDEFQEDRSMTAFWVFNISEFHTPTPGSMYWRSPVAKRTRHQENTGQPENHNERSIEQTTSLLAHNADLKAQIQEKVFAIAALKNDLRKLKGNSVDTKRESTFAKPDHMIASSKSRSSSKNMPRFSSNDMVHNHYLDEARKKTQERDRNSKTSVMPSARFQSTANGSKPKPKSTNHSTKSLPKSKSSCVTITVVPKEDHSKSSSYFSDSKHFVCSTCHKKIFTGHRFSPNKTSAVYEKTSPRSDLRWKPTGRIFKSVGLRWIPTRKLFDSCTSKVDSEPPYGSNVHMAQM